MFGNDYPTDTGHAVREQLQQIIAGDLDGLAASQAIADARKEVDSKHQAFLDALNGLIAAESALAANARAQHGPTNCPRTTAGMA
jgi:hypothetical protein